MFFVCLYYRNGTFAVVGQEDYVFESDSSVRLSLNGKMPPELQFWGPSGSAYSLEYTDHLGVADSWQVLTNFVGPASPFIWTDANVSPNSRRFYRAVVTE